MSSISAMWWHTLPNLLLSDKTSGCGCSGLHEELSQLRFKLLMCELYESSYTLLKPSCRGLFLGHLFACEAQMVAEQPYVYPPQTGLSVDLKPDVVLLNALSPT